jgi:hypothetical protein
MAKGAEKSRVRISLNDHGEIVLWVGELSESLTDGGVDNLINMLSTAKSDSKEVMSAMKRIKAVTKPYNTVGKILEVCNLKNIEEGAALPEGVISDEAA